MAGNMNWTDEFLSKLCAIGVEFKIANQMSIDDFRSISDFTGLTAERLMGQYPSLKFGTAHRLCLAATKLQEAFDVSSVKIIKNGELHGSILDGQEVPKTVGRIVKFDPDKHGDELVKLMLNYYGTKTALLNMANDFGFKPDARPEATARVTAEDIVDGCFEDGRLEELFHQLRVDFNGDIEMTAFLSQFQPNDVKF